MLNDLQQMMEACFKYDLGLDLRTAAYISAVNKMVHHYNEAGLTFA